MDAREQERFRAIGELKRRGLSPIEAIKAVRSQFAVGLGEAKQFVMSHPAWADEAAAGDILHEEIQRALSSDSLEPPDQQPMITTAPLDAFAARLAAGDQSVVRDLVASGADLNLPHSRGRTALMIAACVGLCGIVEELLAAGVSVNAAGESGLTALHEAAANGHDCVILALLSAGAEVDAESVDGATPLMCAAAWGRIDAARVLIEFGADLRRRDHRGGTASDIASEKCEDEMAEFLEAIAKNR